MQPLVIIVHGLGGNRGIRLRPVHDRRAARGGFPVARVDLRGAGMSGEVSARAVITAVGPRICALSWTLSVGAAPWSGSPWARTPPSLLGEHGPAVVAIVFCPAGSRRCRTPAPHRRRVVRKVPATPPATKSLRPAARFTPRNGRPYSRPRASSTSTMPSPAPRNGGATLRSTTGSIRRSASRIQCSSHCYVTPGRSDDPLGPYGRSIGTRSRRCDWFSPSTVVTSVSRQDESLVCGNVDIRVPQVVCVSRSRPLGGENHQTPGRPGR